MLNYKVHLTVNTYSKINLKYFYHFLFSGSAQGPLRSSLKKTKMKDKAMDVNSVSSHRSSSSSKQVRISLGAEQTQVWTCLNKFKQVFSIHVKCFFRPIFHFWFLVTFDDKIMKIRKYYVIFVYILQGKMGKTEKSGKKIMELKWRKYQKPKDENMGWTKQSLLQVRGETKS